MTVTNNNFLSPANTLANPYPNTELQPSAGSAAALARSLGGPINYLNPEMKNPYSMRWNFDVQHTFKEELPYSKVAHITTTHSVHADIGYPGQLHSFEIPQHAAGS